MASAKYLQTTETMGLADFPPRSDVSIARFARNPGQWRPRPQMLFPPHPNPNQRASVRNRVPSAEADSVGCASTPPSRREMFRRAPGARFDSAIFSALKPPGHCRAPLRGAIFAVRIHAAIMRKFCRLALLMVLWAGAGFGQSLDDPFSQGSPQQQNAAPDCSDPTMAGTAQCSGQNQPSPAGNQSSAPTRPPVLTPVPGASQEQLPATGASSQNPAVSRSAPAVRPETEFEQMVADSVGHPLPLFGQSLFVAPPSTFSPVDLMQVPSDYVIGPGDELQIAVWGQVEANLRVVVDRSGQIYIPHVGDVSVAGVHYGELETYLKNQISRIFKNFNLTANMGRLRTIQVFVVGEARYPGTYTISALSSLVNAIFACGGPSPHGSLRDIEVRRDGKTITHFDLYDLLIKGDKSKDVQLQSGDVLYIPHVGPLAAISGSVNAPAIYELTENSTLQDLIEVAGDLSTVADPNRITVDRIEGHAARKTLEFPYDDQSRALPLKDGDIVRVLSIVPRFEDTVTLRGNVANPGRYPWKPGMRIRDLIPDAQALLTREYWRNRADTVTGSATEYPVRKELRRPKGPPYETPPQANYANTVAPNGTQPNGMTPGTTAASETPGQQASTGTAGNAYPPEAVTNGGNGAFYYPNQPMVPNGVPQTAGTMPTPQPAYQAFLDNRTRNRVRDVVDDVRSYAPEINWDYAIIQRVNAKDLTSKLIWMSPRKAIIEKDEASNLKLEPGDIVTIFSQKEINVPQADQSQYVIVEGEVMRPGVYKLEQNETMRSILERAGGLTPNAYVYGAQFTRESAREDQQKSLDELARSMEVQIRQTAMSVAASTSPGDLPQMMAAQEAIIEQLRNTRASGRVALAVRPKDKNVSDFPDLVMEDGDHLLIPHTPATIAVVGDVYNPGSFIYEPHNTTGDYLEIAGKGKPQSDLHHAFVLRANGVVVAANNVNGVFTGAKFERIRLYPGDEIVVPYKMPTGAFVRTLRDWTQITSQLALTAAALAIVAP
jgi:protein involved in polysaccharide export with SLBB domain